MADVPKELKYTREHEWVRQVEGGRIVVGITDHAQRQLGDVVYVELPKVGETIEAESPLGSIESVKAVSEFFAPVGGKVLKVNAEVVDDPELINTEPYGDGWLIELQPSDAKQLNGLMDAQAYLKYIEEEANG
ncbi:glycine cleavage system protein GcvH [Hyalangium versicolor]|uniref:glycine cleavage system protein GcvH n=1 Tax=Hyalangium versicolor TaxID=2861190 RepID=UPI001CCC2B4C|nr:glycine cleavage system protein GcvH [Hyalangium versicolor]